MFSNKRGAVAALTSAVALAGGAAILTTAPAHAAAETAGDTWTIDASDCPDSASVPLGEGEPIRMGITLTMTGPGSAPQLAEGMQAYFNMINATQGGVAGHELQVTVKDDAFDAARAVANITEFIQSDNIFAIAGQQGSANILASRPTVEEHCMPQFLVPAGAPAFGDPENHPWTSTSQMAYDTEAGLWAKFLDEEFPDGAKVAMLVFNSEFGQNYIDALTEALAGSPHELVEIKRHEASAVNIDNEMTALAAAAPDVMIAATAGAFCTQSMTGADGAGFEGTMIMSALCLGISAFFGPAGEAADGALQIQSFKDPADPAFADDPAVQEYIAQVTEYGESGVDPLNGFVSAGWRNAAALVHLLGVAAESPEGLTRVSLANAHWNIDYVPPLAQDGVVMRMAGTADAYPVESGTMFRFDAAGQTMVSTGLTLSVEGETGVYSG